MTFDFLLPTPSNMDFRPSELACKLAVLATSLFTISGYSQSQGRQDPGLLQIYCDATAEVPAWALYERQLIHALDQAGIEFYQTYVDEEGRVTFKERYEGGMNSSDDLYEAFRGFSLHTSLGGSHEIDKRHRKVWNGITKQFTRYGQIYREFDANWDWMHHGEGYVSLYPMGMVQPNDTTFRNRSIRFADMYMGDDPESQNYDANLKMMRSVMNGSRGPKMTWTKRDWIPTNANLVYYPLPFQDIPGIEGTTAWINDHPNNDQFAKLVRAMSDRMAKGDVPINLTVAPLIANAFLYTGESKYVDWITDYVGAWQKRTKENQGITPDNVGLSGKIGEYTGHWWGGYYGWVWPRGGTDIVLAELTAAKVATLLTGQTQWLELPRSQMALMRDQGELIEGTYMMPIRHDHRGWYHAIREPAYPYLNLWYFSHDEEDWQEIERLAQAEIGLSGQITDPDLAWAYFVKGLNPEYPEQAFRRDLGIVAQKIKMIRVEHGDPETWVDNKWINMDPMLTHNLTRLSVGGIPVHVRGEMLHAQVRYFDGEKRCVGLPKDVSALVKRIEEEWIELEIINLHTTETRHLIVQGGAYGEHQIREVTYDHTAKMQAPVGNPTPRHNQPPEAASRSICEIKDKAFAVILTPGAGTTLRIGMERYANKPSYDYPW